MADHHRVKPPKTPLKRVSRNSLRSHMLSASHPGPEQIQRPGTSSNQQASAGTEPAAHLAHLEPLFADLADAVTDLHVNLSNLDLVCQDLDGFNEAFASFIYGLRMNAYTTDFEQAPKLASFQDAAAQKENDRRRAQAEAEAKREEREEQTRKAESRDVSQEESFLTSDRSTAVDSGSSKSTAGPSHRSGASSSTRRPTHQSAASASANPSGPKPKSYTQAPKPQQRQLLKFAEQVLTLLPLKFREQQPHRQEMELVVSLLKLHPNGLYVKDIVKLEPTVPMHRARECCTTLVAAKQAVKLNKDGLLYKLLVTN